MKGNIQIKLQTHNVAYNLSRDLGTLRDFVTKKLGIWCLQKTYLVDVKILFQFVFLPNSFEAYSRNIYIPSTVELTLTQLTPDINNF